MSATLWLSTDRDETLELGGTMQLYEAFAEMARVAGDAWQEYADLAGVVSQVEDQEDAPPDWLADVRGQAQQFLESFGEQLSEEAVGVLEALAGRAVQECQDAPEILDVPDVRQSTDYSCGRACLIAVARFFGVEPTPDQLAALGTDAQDGTSPDQLRSGLSSLDLETHTTRGEMTQGFLRGCLDQGMPVLTTLLQNESDPDGHWVIVIGFGPDSVHLQDPAAGRVEMPLAEFERRWEKHGVAVWK